MELNGGGRSLRQLLTFLNAAGLRLAKEMIFTAQPMDAARAERLGLINRVVPAAELEAVTLGLAQQIAANAPLSVAVMKEQLRILAGVHPMTPQGFERVQGLRRVVYDSADYREGSVPSRRSVGPCSRARDGRPPLLAGTLCASQRRNVAAGHLLAVVGSGSGSA